MDFLICNLEKHIIPAMLRYDDDGIIFSPIISDAQFLSDLC